MWQGALTSSLEKTVEAVIQKTKVLQRTEIWIERNSTSIMIGQVNYIRVPDDVRDFLERKLSRHLKHLVFNCEVRQRDNQWEIVYVPLVDKE